jgi:hypothetical protein
MNFFPASELFEIKVQNNQVFPLNLEFEIKPENSGNFKGPGIYFLYYKNELVYIGSFFKSVQKNDVRIQRWKKELATISMRGWQTTMNATSNRALDNSINLRNVARKPKGDFLTSKKRIEFADLNWNEFSTNNFLKDFTFHWFPEEKNLTRSKKQLEILTNQLREFYKPTCNG